MVKLDNDYEPPVIPLHKDGLFILGKELVNSFCELNNIQIPKITRVDISNWSFDVPGYYRPDTEVNRKWMSHPPGIVICVDKCQRPALPSEVPSRNWSWPGNIIDQTLYGVLAHELGHHCDWLTGDVKGRYFSNYCEEVKEKSGEEGITSYANKNPAEWFAEGFRLFLTNPHLHSLFRPRMHATLLKKWKPLVGPTGEITPWEWILGANVPKRIVSSIRNKGIN